MLKTEALQTKYHWAVDGMKDYTHGEKVKEHIIMSQLLGSCLHMKNFLL